MRSGESGGGSAADNLPAGDGRIGDFLIADEDFEAPGDFVIVDDETSSAGVSLPEILIGDEEIEAAICG